MVNFSLGNRGLSLLKEPCCEFLILLWKTEKAVDVVEENSNISVSGLLKMTWSVYQNSLATYGED